MPSSESEGSPRADKPVVAAEVDPRFSLANERTFLAWLRTALGVLAAGFGVHVFAPPDPMQKVLASLLVVVGTGICIGGLVRWYRVERALSVGRMIPIFGYAKVLAALFTLAGAITLTLILLA